MNLVGQIIPHCRETCVQVLAQFNRVLYLKTCLVSEYLGIKRKEEAENFSIKMLIIHCMCYFIQAPTEEINSAYRRFSRMFHPDKHSTDPNKQKWAEQIFNKVKEAYEVLSDSHKRAIYDTLGKIKEDVSDLFGLPTIIMVIK